MPFIDGKRVSNDEWIERKSGPALDWKQVTGWTDPVEENVEPEPVRKARRTGRKKKETEAALAAVTGQDIELDDLDQWLADENEDHIPDPETEE